MDRKIFLKKITFLIIFIFLFNILAHKFHWYFTVWYFDMIMHFLGGLWVGLFAIYLNYNKIDKFDFIFILKILLVVFFIGFGWEIFEIIVDKIITHDPFNLLDTSSDIFFDLAGGGAALLYCLRKIVPFGVNELK